jgi:7-cyano-7-deazaguanine synthase
VLDLAALGQISDTALTRDVEFQMTEAGLPNTFVPGRNLLFLTYAAALAYRRGIRTLVGGMCETDYSGYPDCRNETLQSLARSITLGMDAPFAIETPLMWIDKAATLAMAEALGGPALVDLIVEHTHTCYTPDRTTRHAWGFGCGQCPACLLRAKGWDKWQIAKS